MWPFRCSVEREEKALETELAEWGAGWGEDRVIWGGGENFEKDVGQNNSKIWEILKENETCKSHRIGLWFSYSPLHEDFPLSSCRPRLSMDRPHLHSLCLPSPWVVSSRCPSQKSKACLCCLPSHSTQSLVIKPWQSHLYDVSPTHPFPPIPTAVSKMGMSVGSIFKLADQLLTGLLFPLLFCEMHFAKHCHWSFWLKLGDGWMILIWGGKWYIPLENSVMHWCHEL